MSQSSEQARAESRSLIDIVTALPEGPAYPCPYLPGREARNRAFLAERFDPLWYRLLMDRGFRRSGTLFYQPACQGCNQCKAIRVPVARFNPSRSQRRVSRKNLDLTVTVGPPVFSTEKHDLYVRYLARQHDDSMGQGQDDARGFLYESPVETLEFCYRLRHKLVAVGIADISEKALSSVYLMFDPDQAWRSPGTYSILWEIAWCRRRQIPYYYLGFYVRDCRKMNYKARFRPCELLGDDGQWRSPEKPAEKTTDPSPSPKEKHIRGERAQPSER